MKKLILLLSVVTCFASFSTASNLYKINDAEIDMLFGQAIEVDFESTADVNSINQDKKTVGGYLIRSFFCGSFALHRSYMGTAGETLWWKYLCIPVVGGVVGCVDFWYVVFKGEEALNKYKDNGKFIVWKD